MPNEGRISLSTKQLGRNRDMIKDRQLVYDQAEGNGS